MPLTEGERCAILWSCPWLRLHLRPPFPPAASIPCGQPTQRSGRGSPAAIRCISGGSRWSRLLATPPQLQRALPEPHLLHGPARVWSQSTLDEPRWRRPVSPISRSRRSADEDTQGTRSANRLIGGAPRFVWVG